MHMMQAYNTFDPCITAEYTAIHGSMHDERHSTAADGVSQSQRGGAKNARTENARLENAETTKYGKLNVT